MGTYRRLDPEQTIATIGVLGNRILERFPDSGLQQVCAELTTIARESRERMVWFSRPHYLMRFLIGQALQLIIEEPRSGVRDDGGGSDRRTPLFLKTGTLPGEGIAAMMPGRITQSHTRTIL